MSEPLLEVEGLCAGYGDGQVLEDISFTIPRGSSLAVLGRNGVGKTTLLVTLMGLTRIRGGRMQLRGTDLGPVTPVDFHGSQTTDTCTADGCAPSASPG